MYDQRLFQLNALFKRILGRFGGEGIERFVFKGDDVRWDVLEKYGFAGDLLDIYSRGGGPLVHKWHHYLPIYDRYFSPYRGRSVRFLEIGVFKGGSMAMWRKYFGEDAIIYGVDVDENCRAFDGVYGNVRIGSQDDPGFLSSVIDEMGGVDVILDDGSHMMPHIKKSLDVLFPKLSIGGVYMIEDLHTSYWRSYGGGRRSKKNFYAYIREMVDDMHHWYHNGPVQHEDMVAALSSIHIYDSIVVFEKSPCFPPTHSMVY